VRAGAEDGTKVVGVLNAVEEQQGACDLSGRERLTKALLTPGSTLAGEDHDSLVMDRFGESFEVFGFDDVIGAALIGAPLQERAELPDAFLQQVDADDVIGAPGEEGMAGVAAVKLLFVVAGSSRRIARRARVAVRGAFTARTFSLGAMA
jgi:hypothetical protein